MNKVYNLKHLNQFVIAGDNTKTFQSYDSTIAVYDYQNQSLTFGRDWDCSSTTLKHLYEFLNKCIPTFKINGLQVALESKNKKASIQKLIDKGVIIYNSRLI